MGFFDRFRGAFARNEVRFETTTRNTWKDTKNFQRSDYAYWQRVKESKARGLEIAGLLLKPLASKIASWSMGSAPTWELANNVDYQDDLNAWWKRHYTDFLRSYEVAVHEGDCGIIINADMTVTVIPANSMTAIRATDDPSIIVGWEVYEKFTDPSVPGQTVIIIDRYTTVDRTRSVQIGSNKARVTRYPNLIGILPIFMISNKDGVDAEFGRAEGKPLIPLLQWYGEVLHAAILGNIRQGRPTPVIEKMGDANEVRKFWGKFAKARQQRMPDGSFEEVIDIEFNADKLLTLGKDATFKWAAPGSFVGDTEKLLALLFYILVQWSEIPEFVWGVAITSSKASTETQFEPFIKWIEKRRGQILPWMMTATEIVLRYMALSKPGRMPEFDLLMPQWAKLITENGRLTLDTVAWGLREGLITEELAARLAPVAIDDPIREVKKARKQWEEKERLKADIKALSSPTPKGSTSSTNIQGRNDQREGNPANSKTSGQPEARQSGTKPGVAGQ